MNSCVVIEKTALNLLWISFDQVQYYNHYVAFQVESTNETKTFV